MRCIACQTVIDIYSDTGVWVARALNPAELKSSGTSLVICSDNCCSKLDAISRSAFVKVNTKPKSKEVSVTEPSSPIERHTEIIQFPCG